MFTDVNGNIYSSGVMAYSLGAYCAGQVDLGEDTAELAAAIAVYGYYAAAYFA